jgi:hypothetical protein
LVVDFFFTSGGKRFGRPITAEANIPTNTELPVSQIAPEGDVLTPRAVARKPLGKMGGGRSSSAGWFVVVVIMAVFVSFPSL